jgi:flagellar hook-associated protein 2
LRAPSGTSQSASDVFKSRAAYLTANGSIDAASSVSATVESGATTGSFELTVTQLAKTHKVTGSGVTSNTADLGYSGTISLGGGDQSAQIEITSTMSLLEIAEAINSASGSTGVQASVLKVSASSYQLVLSSTATGTTMTASSVSGDDVLQALGITDSNGAFANPLQAPQQAIFTVDGIEITRSSNDVDDVVEGVTLHLYQATPDDTSITIEVGTDLSAVKEAILVLVEAYSAYRDFAYAQQQLPSSSNEDTTVLFGDVALRNINATVASALNTTVDTNALSLIGLSFDSANKLVLDESVLNEALLSNLESVQSLLSFQVKSSSSDLLLLARGSKVPADFTLDIVTDSSGAITSASVGGNENLFTVNGTRIIGKAGTAFEGFTFVYAGAASKSVAVGFSTGIAELLYNAANAATNAQSGTLTQLVGSLSDINDALQTKSDDIRDRAETYQTKLTSRYAAYQSAVAMAEALQDYLTTLLETWNSSS